jgi:tryptophan-rich sensory protein
MLGLANTALVAGSARLWYISLVHPAVAMPGWLFRPAWGLLYLTSATAAWLVWRRSAPGFESALRLWGWGLLAIAIRVAMLFGARSLPATLATSIICTIVLGAIVKRFLRHSRPAAWLMVPSLLWTGYLVYLSLGLIQLNPG